VITFKDIGHYGRLGNQLFQIASTIGIANTNNDVAVFPKWFCNYTKKEMSRFFKNNITETLPHNYPVPTYEEPAFSYNHVHYNNNVNLHGYFQSEKYFKHCEHLIRHYFQPTDAVVAYLFEKYGDVIKDKITCSIHIRRGDYVKNNVHDVCDIAYYNRAISYIQSNAQVEKFLIFSDDIEWCKNTFTGNYVFVEGNLDIEDLFLMSSCTHNIIANSSFSWWGSWLNTNQNKIIIAPDKWFGTPNLDYRDVYTQNMIRL
jgi:hypothetical protein